MFDIYKLYYTILWCIKLNYIYIYTLYKSYIDLYSITHCNTNSKYIVFYYEIINTIKLWDILLYFDVSYYIKFNYIILKLYTCCIIYVVSQIGLLCIIFNYIKIIVYCIELCGQYTKTHLLLYCIVVLFIVLH